ncbi:hypothetical protein [Roseisolibacter sp. H3M3-2]|uniref:hypothetical protein n=1 Tax=Roseisolibacter sp. H3M3-2 TaxID=3031323 RepID=UPI0023DCCEF6|nr:hypothetical protein [Roseisolibacter sp. H3M3-2]MDF1506213.1 hypothetical protein [Roseisolibacter sp. H3M3-2]
MSALEIEMGYPLAWPNGRPRTPLHARKAALFKEDGRRLTLTVARRRLREQLSLMTRTGQPWRTTDILVSTNIRFTLQGTRDQNVSRRDPEDTGAALYFDFDGSPHVLACDRWDTVQDNIAAIAAHIEALRGQERWGCADLRLAFAGHVALPASDPWWKVLGVTRDAPIEAITRAYRALARTAHPNAGGERAAWDRLQRAYDEAQKAAG